MGRKEKVSVDVKIESVEAYLNGDKSIIQLSIEIGASETSIRNWITKYKTSGATALINKHTNNRYTKEFKKMIVGEYLSGEGSLESLAAKYLIGSKEVLRNWVKMYNSHIELKDYNPKPEVYMTDNRRKTTKEERIEIVEYCLDHNKDYKGTASLYDISYTQVYNWVKKYLLDGEDGLNDRRGVHKKDDEVDELEQLRRRVKSLERQLKESQMESELLKKVQEIERRRFSPKADKKQNI